MAFKDKIYVIITKIYDIIKKYSPIDKEDCKLIFFGLFINALSNYTVSFGILKKQKGVDYA